MNNSSIAAVNQGSLRKKFKEGFAGTSLNTNDWTTSAGTGGAVAVSSNTLLLTSGVTINDAVSATLNQVFRIPSRITIGLGLSQRIANQAFYLDFFSVDPLTGIADGLNQASLLFDGTIATNNKVVTQCKGGSVVTSSAISCATTAGAVSLYELEVDTEGFWVYSSTLNSTTNKSSSYKQHTYSPDPNAFYKVRLRWVNGATAPASTSVATINYFVIQDYDEVYAELQNAGQNIAGQSLPVNIVTNTMTAPLPTYELQSNTAGGITSYSKLIAAATTNATLVKSSGTYLNELIIHNLSAAVRYVKIFNLAVAPTVGTSVPVHVFAIPAGNNLQLTDLKLRLSTGFSFCITTGYADTDTGACAAGDVIVNYGYV